MVVIEIRRRENHGETIEGIQIGDLATNFRIDNVRVLILTALSRTSSSIKDSLFLVS